MQLYMKYTLPFILLLTAVGCSDAPDAPPTNEESTIRLELNPVIAANAETTRATVNSTNGQLYNGTYNFGVYIYRFVDNDPTQKHYPHNESLINFLAKYTVNSKNLSWQYTIDNYVYDFLAVQAGIPYDVYAYYPYIEEITDPEKIPFDSSQAKDWLVSDKVLVSADQTGDTGGTITVPLKFNHLMTCIEVNVRSKYKTYPYVAKATLSDSKSRIGLKGFINLYDKSVTVDNQDKAEIIEQTYSNVWLEQSTELYRSFQFIIPEIDNVDKDDLKFTLTYQKRINNSKEKLYTTEYTLPLTFKDGNKVTSLERGKKYVYYLVLDHVFTFEGLTIEEEGKWTKEEKSDMII